MCGRFAVTLPPEAMRQLFDARYEGPAWPARYNIAPSQTISILRLGEDGGREIAPVRWGLHPSWLREPPGPKSMINARSETAPDKPYFRTAFKKRRCLIAMDGFYEWRRAGGTKTPYFIRPKDGSPLVCAGLWERWRDPESDAVLDTAALLTTGPNALMAPIHDRMPLVIAKEGWAFWLSPTAPRDALEAMMGPAPDDLLEAFAVSRAVNNPANDGPSLMIPAPA